MQSINISVDLNNDPIFENNEMFQGTLTIISGERVSLDLSTADATIIEDEGMYITHYAVFLATHNYYTVEAKFNFFASDIQPFFSLVVVCQELELLVNGSIEYSPDTTAPYLEGTNAQHICFPGFFLIGNVNRVCQSDSTFSKVPPTCQRKLLLY